MKNIIGSIGRYLIIIIWILGLPITCLASEREEKARETAEVLINRLQQAGAIKDLSLTYGVELDTIMKVRLKTEVTLEKRLVKTGSDDGNGDGGYVASFTLEPPRAVGAWSWLAMNIYGYESEEYRDMVKSLNVRVEEIFTPGECFKTARVIQRIKEKNYANQTPIEVVFSDGRIDFWADATDKTKPPQYLRFTGQVGPLTGFFNYLLRYNPLDPFTVINVLNSVHDTGETDAATGLKIKAVEFMFRDEPIIICANDAGADSPYHYEIRFYGDNFLDIIQGKIAFALARGPAGRVNIPYAIAVDGVFSENKKHRRDEDLKKLRNRKHGMDIAEFERERVRIENRSVLGAWNIDCRLVSFTLNGHSFPR